MTKDQRNIRRVMIVEDDLDILLLYKDFFRSKGYHVVASSATADDILFDYDNYCPDVVIIDYRLPGKKDGLQAIRELLTKNAVLPILLITAFENLKAEISTDDFFKDKKVRVLIKPIKLAQLEENLLGTAR
jgi:DNA-binding response OmpR family regulator